VTWRIECCSRASFIKPGGRFQYVYRRFSGCLPDLNHQNAKTEFFRTGKLFKIYKGTFQAKSFLVYSLFVPWRGICRYQFTYVSPPKVRFRKKNLILSSDAVFSGLLVINHDIFMFLAALIPHCRGVQSMRSV
jgi:hypothetical protein